MKRLWLAFVVCCLAVCAARAQEDRPCRPRAHARLPALKELTYHRARKRLVAAGWRPLRTKAVEGTDGVPDGLHGNGPEFWRSGYFEVESCAGTGWANCSFLFEDAYGNRLRVITAGEELRRPRSYARVSGLRFVCE